LVNHHKSKPKHLLRNATVLCPMPYIMWRCSFSLLCIFYHVPLDVVPQRPSMRNSPVFFCHSVDLVLDWWERGCQVPTEVWSVYRLGKLTVPKCWCLIRASESQSSQQRVTLSILSHRTKMPLYSGGQEVVFPPVICSYISDTLSGTKRALFVLLLQGGI